MRHENAVRTRGIWLPLLAILSLACASDDFEISRTFDPLTRFPATATYAWDPRGSSLPDDPRLAELDLDRIIRASVDAQLASRGYRVTRGAADYRLSYQLRVHTWIGADNSRSQGSFSLNLAESASKQRVWTSFARAEVHIGLSHQERRQRFDQITARMLEGFPPPGR